MAVTLVYFSDNEYIDEAQVSILSFKRHHPDSQSILMTDEKSDVKNFDRTFKYEKDDKPFFCNRLNAWHWILDRIYTEHILFLDSDTYCCASIHSALRLLKRYDLLAAHAPGRSTGKSKSNAPISFAEINCGVIFANNNTAIKNLIWQSVRQYKKFPSFYSNDQPVVRDMLWEQKTKFYVLPTEYNFRFRFGGQLRSLCRILHGHSKKMQDVARIVNKGLDIRAFGKGELAI